MTALPSANWGMRFSDYDAGDPPRHNRRGHEDLHLRDAIWRCYELQLIDEYRKCKQATNIVENTDDPTF